MRIEHEWTPEDLKTLEDFGLHYDEDVYGYVLKYSSTAFGIKPVISLVPKGYLRGYTVWVSGDNGNRCMKSYQKLPEALMEFARWQGRGQAENKLKHRIESVKELLCGQESYSPV